MKKAIISLLLITVLALSGCGKTESNKDAANTEESTAKQTEANNSETEKTAEPASEPEGESTEKSLEGLEQYMLDNGILTGTKSEKSAEMIGAISGFGYDGGIEVYEYDTSSENYVHAQNDEDIPLKGMDDYFIHAAAVNGPFVLILSNGELNQNAIDIFSEY